MILLITGIPASGKSTIASLLSKLGKFVVVSQDTFYKVEFTTHPEESNINLEKDDLIDWNKLCDVVDVLSKHVNVVVEGHRLLDNKSLVKKADKIIFLEVDKSTCESRYISRYDDSNLEKKSKYFNDVVWKEHVDYKAKAKTMYENRITFLPGVIKTANLIKLIL
jgi:uridine kinase